MGILNCHKFFRNEFKLYKKVETLDCIDHLYIDINFIAHLYTHSKIDKLIINFVCATIKKIFISFPAKKSLNLLFDGCANIGKIVEQLNRRKDQSVDSLTAKLSVGTPFMIDLNNALKSYININAIFNNIIINIDHSINKDEAEIKYIRYVKKNDNKDSHYFVTNDADVLLINMFLQNEYNVNILYKLTNDKYESISMQDNIAHICKENNLLNNNISINLAVCLMFMGNDYFPKVCIINYDNLLKIVIDYTKDYNNLLYTDSKIDICGLYIIFTNISAVTYNKLKFNNIMELYDKHTDDKIDNYLSGIAWCSDVYMTGICKKNDYYCYMDCQINPLFVLKYLYKLKKINTHIKAPISSFVLDNVNIYKIIVLPFINVSYIDKEYYPFIKKNFKKLYGEELCLLCFNKSDIIKNNNLFEISDSESDVDSSINHTHIIKKNKFTSLKDMYIHIIELIKFIHDNYN